MLTEKALNDFRQFIKRRIASARYRVDGAYYDAKISEIEITNEGTVRVKIPISHGAVGTITQVQLISVAADVWASKDVSIELGTAQTNIMQWFDFNITEHEEVT